jgi:uncharacterized membrane protein HdeD (DUF308 family)
MEGRRLVLVSYVTVLSGFGLWGLTAALLRDVDFTNLKIVATAGAALLAGGAAYASVALRSRVRSTTFPSLLLGAAPIAFALVAYDIWGGSFTAQSSQWAQTAIVVLVAGVLTATLRLLVRFERPLVGLIYVGFVVCAAATSGVALRAIWGSPQQDDARLFTAFAVLTVFAYLLAPAIDRLLEEPA